MAPRDMSRVATCSCGQLRVTVSGEPFRVSVCHCTACQRRTGSAFGAQARFRRDQMASSGRANSWVRTADSGNRISFDFCPDCGTTVSYRPEAEEDTVAVALGCFADPDFAVPTVSVYETRRHPWVELPGDLDRFD